MLVWHYTYRSPEFLGSILDDREIHREGECVADAPCIMLVPAVWFSSNGHYEPTARKPFTKRGQVMLHTIEQSLPVAARIAVDDAGLLTWEEFIEHAVKVKGTPAAEHLHRMGEWGRSLGADPNQWYASLERVHESRWLNVEYHDGREWYKP